ncbi:MAG: hypothetical protein ACTJHW_01140 [Paenalcaligenes sp.]
MNYKAVKYSVVAMVFLLVSGCANVRWSHPAPSSELVQEVANDIYGIKYEKDYTAKTEEHASKEEFDLIMNNPPTKETRGIGLVTRVEGEDFFMAGYSTHFYKLGLRSEKDYARYNIEDKPAIGYKYAYQGKITGVAFQSPHMAMSSDDRTTLVLRTTPVSAFKVKIFYEDNTSAEFEFLSSKLSSRFGGGFKQTPLSYFDGWLLIDHSYYSDTFTVDGPYNR